MLMRDWLAACECVESYPPRKKVQAAKSATGDHGGGSAKIRAAPSESLISLAAAVDDGRAVSIPGKPRRRSRKVS